MDHGAVNRAFVADFLAVWDGDNPILDVGTGTAQIPIELCRQAAAARVVAIDRAHEMLRVAQDNVRHAGLETRLTLEVCDAKSMPYGDRSFVRLSPIASSITFPSRNACLPRWYMSFDSAARCLFGISCGQPTRPRWSSWWPGMQAMPILTNGKCSGNPCTPP